MPVLHRTYTAQEIADLLGLELSGDGQAPIDAVLPLSQSHESSFGFYRDGQLPRSIGCVCAQTGVPCAKATLITPNPRHDFGRFCVIAFPKNMGMQGIHPTAQIDPTAVLGAQVCVGPYAVIGPDVKIAENVVIGSHVVIEEGVSIGASTHIGAKTIISRWCDIGQRCVISPGVIIGDDGFTYDKTAQGWQSCPQISRVIIGHDVDIGPGCVIDRGMLEDTVIEEGCKIDAMCMIAHGVKIGAHTLIAGATSIAGSTQLGQHCLLGGRCAVGDNLKITDGVILSGATCVVENITDSGHYVSRSPVMPWRDWTKRQYILNTFVREKLSERTKRISDARNK